MKFLNFEICPAGAMNFEKNFKFGGPVHEFFIAIYITARG